MYHLGGNAELQERLSTLLWGVFRHSAPPFFSIFTYIVTSPIHHLFLSPFFFRLLFGRPFFLPMAGEERN